MAAPAVEAVRVEAGPSKAVRVDAVVVAAGASRRMGGRDKLDAELLGRSILRWSIEVLAEAGVERIVVVTSPWRIPDLAAAPWLPGCVVAVVAGGERRQESVAAGVAALAETAPPEPALPGPANRGAAAGRSPGLDSVILVHDAARPLASAALVRAVAEATASHGAAIPVLPVTETLKRLDGDVIGETVDRTDVVAAQTPQGVRRSLLERAYAAFPPDGPETWTDEASLLEACRIPVHAISGEATNLKVTVPVDLERARAMLDRGLVPGRPAGAAREGSKAPAPPASARGCHPRRLSPAASKSARTAIPSAQARPWSWAASSSTACRGWPVIRTATSPCMPSPTRSWAPPAWAIWAGSFLPTRGRPPVSTAERCSVRSPPGSGRRAGGRSTWT